MSGIENGSGFSEEPLYLRLGRLAEEERAKNKREFELNGPSTWREDRNELCDRLTVGIEMIKEKREKAK